MQIFLMNMHCAARSDPLIYIPLGSYNMKLEAVISTYLSALFRKTCTAIFLSSICEIKGIIIALNLPVCVSVRTCVCVNTQLPKKKKIWILMKLGINILQNRPSILSHFKIPVFIIPIFRQCEMRMALQPLFLCVRHAEGKDRLADPRVS